MPLSKASLFKIATLAGVAGIAALSGAAQAQSMSTSSSSFQSGYGLSLHQMQTAVDPSTRDANGNRVMVDGVMSIGSDNSVYSYSKTLGAGDSYSGAGALGGASAIGNNLQVTVQGNYNTVIINSTQTNNGNVTATADGTIATGEQGTLNGQVNF